MPRASQPHTSDAELAAHSAHAARTGVPQLLTPDIVAFCQEGVSIIVALGGRNEAPVAGMACGCRFLDDDRMRLVLLHSCNKALIEAAERGEPVAVTFSRPISHRSIQIKGTNPGIATPTQEDQQAALRQMTGLRDELRQIEHSSRFTDAFCHVDVDDLIAVDFEPGAAFAQTPGPGAGAALKS